MPKSPSLRVSQSGIPEVKQRTAEIATVLEKSGVPRDVVLDGGWKAVEASGIDPDGYASQMMSPAFDAAMKSQGWVRKPSNPMQWEPADLNRARTGTEMAQQKAAMTKAEVVKTRGQSEVRGQSRPAPELSAAGRLAQGPRGCFAHAVGETRKAEGPRQGGRSSEDHAGGQGAGGPRGQSLWRVVRRGAHWHQSRRAAAMPLATDEKGRAIKVALLH